MKLKIRRWGFILCLVFAAWITANVFKLLKSDQSFRLSHLEKIARADVPPPPGGEGGEGGGGGGTVAGGGGDGAGAGSAGSAGSTASCTSCSAV